MDSYFKKNYTMELSENWARILREEVNKEVKNTIITKLLTPKTRKFLWAMCQKFCKDIDGTPGMACRLAERYFMYQVELHKELTVSDKRQLKEKIIEEFLLTIMCCVLIASKVIGRRNEGISCTLARFYLRMYGFNATPLMILRKEFEIMRSIDFSLPLWTGVDTAVVIGMAANMEHSLERIATVMDFAELNLYDINRYINEGTGSTTQLGTTQLAAGVVVAMSQVDHMDTELVARTVATYCAMPIQYVKLIKNVLILRLPEILFGRTA